MTHTNAVKLCLFIAALSFGAPACIGDPESASGEDVAVTAEALGAFTELLNVGNEPPMDLGPTNTVFNKQPVGSCGIADLVLTQTGQHVQ